MARSRLLVPALVATLIVTACGGGGISASTCDEVVDETIELLQRLVDDVDASYPDASVEDFLEAGEELPSLEAFEEDADRIDEIAAELGCFPSDIEAAVDARVGELQASTDVGRFIVTALRSGGL